MKIGIDARMMNKNVRGIGRYVERLLVHLAEADKENEYVVFTRQEAVSLVPKTMKTVITDIRWYTLAEQIKLGKIFDAEKLDLLHVPHWNAPLRLKTPLAITIHDMILWERPSLASTTLPSLVYWTKYFFYRFVVAKNAKRAKIVFTVSESAKNSILRNLDISPEKIIVTPNGVDPLVEVSPQPFFVEAKPRQPYILSVSSGYPHKNLATFFKVAKKLMADDKNLATIVVGTDPSFIKRLKNQAKEIIGDNASRVYFAGVVSDAELENFYKNANALIFTSEIEGFGLPPLEAALANVPVIASAIDTSREMLGGIIPLINPFDAAGFVDAYRKFMADSAYKETILSLAKAKAQTFSWERTAELTLVGYKRCFSTR